MFVATPLHRERRGTSHLGAERQRHPGGGSRAWHPLDGNHDPVKSPGYGRHVSDWTKLDYMDEERE